MITSLLNRIVCRRTRSSIWIVYTSSRLHIQLTTSQFDLFVQTLLVIVERLHYDIIFYSFRFFGVFCRPFSSRTFSLLIQQIWSLSHRYSRLSSDRVLFCSRKAYRTRCPTDAHVESSNIAFHCHCRRGQYKIVCVGVHNFTFVTKQW